MGKQSSSWITMHKKRWPLMIFALFTLSTVMVFFMRSAFDSCHSTPSGTDNHFREANEVQKAPIHSVSQSQTPSIAPNPLYFMKSKLVLLVSHELSLSGTLHIFVSVLKFFAL